MRASHGIGRAEFTRQLGSLLDRSGAYALARLGERSDAEDAVQEAALRAWRARASYDPGRPFKGWWYGILRNCCVDALRKRRVARGDPAADLDELPARAGGPEDAIHERQWLESGLGRLSDEHREIIGLRYFAECSYVEIAAALGIPIGTVKSRVHAARRALLSSLGEPGNEPDRS